jgi:hypothetical protein
VDVALAAIEAVGDALTDGAINWEQAAEFVREASLSKSDTVTETAVRVAGDCLVVGTTDWAAVSRILDDPQVERSRPLETAVRGVGDALLKGTVGWATVESFLSDALEDGDRDVAVAAVEAVGGALQEGRVRWASAVGVLGPALDSADRAVRREAARAAGVALQEGHVDWTAVELFFERALNDIDSSVKLAALRPIGYRVQRGTLEWDAVGPLVEAASRDRQNDVPREAVRVVGAGLQNGHLAWADVADFLTRAVRRDPPVATMVVRTVGLGVEHYTVDWTDAASVLDAALVHPSPDVAETAVRAVVDAVRADELAWAEAAGRVTAVVEDGPEGVGTAAVRAIGDLFGESGESWATLGPVFERARRSGSPAVATAAVETVGDVVQRGDLAWAAAAPFLAVARRTGPEDAAREAVVAVGRAYAAGDLDWEELEATLTPSAIDDGPVDRTLKAEATVEALDATLDASHTPARRVADLAADLHEEVPAIGEPLARVAVDTIIDGGVGPGDLDPLLASLIDGGTRTRLVTLAVEFVGVRTGKTASEGPAVLDAGVRDGNGGVRGFAVRVLEASVGSGMATGTGTELCDRLRTCFEQDSARRRGAPHVRTRIVRLAARAIDRRAGPTDRLRTLLIDAAADGASVVRRSALKQLATTYDIDRNDDECTDVVDAIVDAGEADKFSVRMRAVWAAGVLLTSDDPPSDESRDRLAATLSTGLDDRDWEVRRIAAFATARVRDHTGETPVSHPTAIQEVLGVLELPTATRLSLVELLAGTTRSVELDITDTR